jgi:RNA polymerase sigma-70 factor (ECF subfamily)
LNGATVATPDDKPKCIAQLVAAAWRAYDDRLHRFLVRQLQIRQSQEQADDITQEVYLRLLRFKDADLVRNLQAYLYQIARNVLADRLELEGDRRRRLTFDSRIIEMLETGDDHSECDAPVQRTAAIVCDDACEDIAAQAERQGDLDYVLSRLPPMYRAVLLMRKSAGMSYTEIAHELDISVHTVKKYVHLALTQSRSICIEQK